MPWLQNWLGGGSVNQSPAGPARESVRYLVSRAVNQSPAGSGPPPTGASAVTSATLFGRDGPGFETAIKLMFWERVELLVFKATGLKFNWKNIFDRYARRGWISLKTVIFLLSAYG